MFLYDIKYIEAICCNVAREEKKYINVHTD